MALLLVRSGPGYPEGATEIVHVPEKRAEAVRFRSECWAAAWVRVGPET
jgi:hypothetical protein